MKSNLSVFLMFGGEDDNYPRNLQVTSVMALSSRISELRLNPRSLDSAREELYRGNIVVLGFGSNALEALHNADVDGRIFMGDFNNDSSIRAVLEYLQKHKDKSVLIVN